MKNRKILSVPVTRLFYHNLRIAAANEDLTIAAYARVRLERGVKMETQPEENSIAIETIEAEESNGEETNHRNPGEVKRGN